MGPQHGGVRRGGAPTAPLYSAMQRANLDATVKYILDIGANKGDWTRETIKHGYGTPAHKYVLIDGNEGQIENWKDIDATNLHAGIGAKLSNETGTGKWYKEPNQMGTGDALFKENSGRFKDVPGETVNIYTLDDILKEKNLDNIRFDFIKIDCQGAEVHILQGARNTLKSVQAVLLELPWFGEYNKGSPEFADYISFMRSIGFRVYELTEVHRMTKDNFLVQIDILFLSEKAYATVADRLRTNIGGRE